MQSKVHPTYKTKYRVANWAAYNKALVRRGDVTVWLSSDAIAAWTPGRSGRRGGQRRYSDLAIETALTLRLLYHLPLRQAEGFLHALFGMMRLDLSAPDYTTLSRRSQHLQRRLRPIPTGDGLHLVLDSTGLSIVGEGEWAAAKHGGRGRRGWRKLHLGVDRSGVIRVHTLTEATGDDATTALDLLTAVDGPLVRVTADAAYDTVAVYETALLHEDRFVQQRWRTCARAAPSLIGRLLGVNWSFTSCVGPLSGCFCLASGTSSGRSWAASWGIVRASDDSCNNAGRGHRSAVL